MVISRINKTLSVFLPLVLSLNSCNLVNHEEETLPPPQITPPGIVSVESISETKLKLLFYGGYYGSAIIQRSDSVHPFSIIASNITAQYFIDSSVNKDVSYSYRLAGVTGNDTSYYSLPTIVKYLSTNKVLQQIQTSTEIDDLTLSENGTLIATTNDKGIDIRNYNDLSEDIKIIDWNESWGPRIGINFSSDATMITFGREAIKKFNVNTGSEMLSIPRDSTFIQNLFFIDNDNKIFGVLPSTKYGGPYGSVVIWDAKTGSTIQRFDSVFQITQSVALSPDRKTIFLELAQNKLLKFSIGTTVSYSTINLNSSDGSLTYSVDGNYLVGYREGTISFYDSFSGAIIKTLNGDYIFVNHLAISPDGALLLASNSANYEVRVYDIAANSMVRILDASTGVSGLHFSSDGKSFIVAYKDGNISKYSVSELSYSWQRIK